MYKLIKVEDYWIITENKRIENPTVNDLILDEYNQVSHFVDLSKMGLSYGNFKKVLFSTNPRHNLPTITFSDEITKELGIIDFYTKAQEYAIATKSPNREAHRIGFEIGYSRCLSDNEGKKFTLGDIRKAINEGFSMARNNSYGDLPEKEYVDEYIQSLTMQEYFCELKMEDLNDYDDEYSGRLLIKRFKVNYP